MVTGALPVLFWREDDVRGMLSINMPLKTGVGVGKWQWGGDCAAAGLCDDEFPLVAKELSSSCTIFIFPHKMSFKSDHHVL